jgi:CRP-like cAMP-binding protein
MSHVTLPRTGILAFMDDESREKFASYGELITTTKGQVLIREEEVNVHLYIVLSGIYDVTTSAQGTPVHLDAVGVGDCLGEVAIFHPDKASATVTSRKEGQLWSIDVDRLQEFLIDRPDFGCAAILGINIILSRRLKRANAVIRFNQIVPGFLSVRAKTRVVGMKLL